MSHPPLTSPNATELRAAYGPSLAGRAAAPIGVFDSGIGGLSVWQHLRATLPHEDFIYLADTAHVPYGDKPQAWIQERMVQVVNWFLAQGCKAIVIACNTATAMAATYLRERFPDVFLVGLEPAIKPALMLTKNKKIAMLATARTVESEKYAALLDRTVKPELGIEVLSIACVGLADAIDKGLIDDERTLALIDQYLVAVKEMHVDVVVLGCTHYPFVANHIRYRLSSGVKVIDSGAPVARYTKDILLARHGLNAQVAQGKNTWYATQLDAHAALRWQLLSGQTTVDVHLVVL